MEEKPSYYAIIPAEVRYDNDLRANEKLLYGEITALSKQTGECWAGNNYFCELYNVKPNAIAVWIRHLKEKRYIDIEYKYKGKEIQQRIIKIGGIQKDSTYYSKEYEGIHKKIPGGIQKDKENNININNTSINNIKENIKRKYFEDEELNDLFNEFLELRKKLKCKNTDRAITLLLNELNKYPNDIKKEMINNSIMGSWKSVYPLKKTKRTEPIPEWFGKEIVNEKDEEVEEIERRFFESIKNEENES
jgi:hypothetical protein